MKAAVLRAPRTLSIETRPSIAPRPGEVVVQVDGAGLCGTDFRIWNGDRAVDYPRVMGHEHISTTLDRYTHSSKDGQRRVLDSFADFSLTEDDED